MKKQNTKLYFQYSLNYVICLDDMFMNVFFFVLSKFFVGITYYFDNQEKVVRFCSLALILFFSLSTLPGYNSQGRCVGKLIYW